MRFVTSTLFALLFTGPAVAAEPAAPVSGDSVIRAKAGPSDIVITTTSRVAGAIHSLKWNGKEFIDSHDHGRQLQSAANFDFDGKYFDETFNPTEGGSRADDVGDRSTSRLLALKADGAELRTTNQMAFWLAPGEQSGGNLALNKTKLSEHLLRKVVHIGCDKLPHAIRYDVTFVVPKDERHNFDQFEGVTGYMPIDFDHFYHFTKGALKPIDHGPGEQPDPIVLATADGRYAMGVYSPDQPSRGFENVGYGRFHFKEHRVSKWNCVFRLGDKKGLPPGEYTFHHFVIVGSLQDVESTLVALTKK